MLTDTFSSATTVSSDAADDVMVYFMRTDVQDLCLSSMTPREDTIDIFLQ